MGPIIRAEVGDRVVVHLQNKLHFTVNFEPQGLLASEEAYEVVAEPNATAVYTFKVPEQVNLGACSLLHGTCNQQTLLALHLLPSVLVDF